MGVPRVSGAVRRVTTGGKGEAKTVSLPVGVSKVLLTKPRRRILLGRSGSGNSLLFKATVTEVSSVTMMLGPAMKLSAPVSNHSYRPSRAYEPHDKALSGNRWSSLDRGSATAVEHVLQKVRLWTQSIRKQQAASILDICLAGDSQRMIIRFHQFQH